MQLHSSYESLVDDDAFVGTSQKGFRRLINVDQHLDS